MKLMLAFALAATPAATPEVRCELGVAYSASNPKVIHFQVSDKRCDLEGMKTAIATTQVLLNRTDVPLFLTR